MANRIAVPLLDGRWLSLDREVFDASLAAGASLDPTQIHNPPERAGVRRGPA